jgi:hypothetical protein
VHASPAADPGSRRHTSTWLGAARPLLALRIRCTGGGDGSHCRSPCSPVVLGAVDPTKEFYVAIRYIECPSHPVRVPPLGCGCDETACEYSRITSALVRGLVPAFASSVRRADAQQCWQSRSARSLRCRRCCCRRSRERVQIDAHRRCHRPQLGQRLPKDRHQLVGGGAVFGCDLGAGLSESVRRALLVPL